jgi:TPR repeat protein
MTGLIKQIEVSTGALGRGNMRHNSWLGSRNTLGCYCLLLLASAFSFGQDLSSTAPVALASAPAASQLAAANAGDVQAQVAVGKAYNGDGLVRRNYSEAVKWFSAAAAQGSVEASAWLGSSYLYGHGVAQDSARAASLIQAAAAQNNPVGMRFLGMLYEEGQGVEQSYATAAHWYTKAKEQKDANAYDRLAELYLHGLGVKKSVRQAVSLLTVGARLGDSWAQLHLAELYQSGQVHSEAAKSKAQSLSTPNYAMALTLYGSSAAQGNRVSAYKLGELYRRGLGTEQDYAKALTYYQEAAYRRFAPAEVALGKASEQGWGTTIDLVAAQVWYSLAADQGDAAAGDLLALLKSKMTPDQLQQASARLSQWDTLRNNN